ncbi:DNA polymerase [Virgibacillus pantothenticus]|uniref:DNA polymerase n=1 Tax=Virgibacillus pantothenticus TaxID=1473 RepID=UPI00201494B0|nr:DNA polymerase [Virgibacillus pantothenticus]
MAEKNTKIKLTLNLTQEKSGEGKAKAKAAAERKKSANETIEEAWQRIFAMKNSEKDAERLRKVKAYMDAGELGREPVPQGKRQGKFSKAEALRLYKTIAEREKAKKLQELVDSTPENYALVTDNKSILRMKSDIESSELVGFDCETFGEALDPWRGEMAGFSVSTDHAHYYVPLNHVQHEVDDKAIVKFIKPTLESAKLVMHNAPFDCKWMYVKYGVNLIDNLHADTRIMAMLLDENRSHRLKDLMTDWMKVPSDNFDELFGKTPFSEIDLDIALVYAAGDTEKTLELYRWMIGHFDRREDLRKLKRLLFEIEMPVARTFIWSDLRGISFDIEKAKELDYKFAKEEAHYKAEIDRIFGEEINLNSPAQLKRKLFEDLKLPDIANGSTGVKVLKKLENKHEVISHILEYRGVGKLRQAFTEKLPNEIKYDGKIHPWHNTLGAATGRFTCKDPNTQQIPAKRPEVRKLFVADKGRILVSMDFSQIELRVLAHMADEKVLIHAFHDGRDIHSTTAAMISNGKYTYKDIETHKDTDGHQCQKLRKQAKVVNFGIVYGMSAKGLSDTLGISKKEAQEIIDNYFKGYPGISTYMNKQKRMARKKGFVTDIFGRKRRLHDFYKSKNDFDHFRADRQGGNFPIQASAGSMLKKAIVDLSDVLPKYDSHILLQVHDELVFDCPVSISKEALYDIRDTMTNAVELIVPVKSDIEIYPHRWMEKVEENEWFAQKKEHKRRGLDDEEI